MLSVVLPAKDEAENIGHLIEEIHTSLADLYPFEIIVVDDGCSDSTFETALETGRTLGCDVKAIKHAYSVGQSTAIVSGVLQAKYTLMATLDAGGQNDPADLPKLVERAQQIEAANFCVIGYRKNRKDTPWKRFQSRFANKFRDAILHDGVPDTGCGLKVVPTATYLRLPHFNHMHRYIPALVKRMGGEVQVQEVNHRDREHGLSKYTAWNRAWVGIVDVLGMMWLIRRGKVPMVNEIQTSNTSDD